MEIKITENEVNMRIDKFLRKYFKNKALSQIYKIIRKKKVKVNNKSVSENYRLQEGDIILVYENIDIKDKIEIKKAVINFTVIYEDSNLLIVNKPKGIIVHPDKNHIDNTLVDQVIYYLYKKNEYDPNNEILFRPASVNRLDLNTGGLVIFAKNNNSLREINKIIREDNLSKRYLCMVKGKIDKSIDIKAYIKKDEKSNISNITNEKADEVKMIHTIFNSIKYTEEYSLIDVELITGRSHQIRAQLKELGYPIVGDIKYGDKKTNQFFKQKYNIDSQFLFAVKICFKKIDGTLEYLSQKTFECKIPESYNNVILTLL